jgi:prevent-host-death family protein
MDVAWPGRFVRRLFAEADMRWQIQEAKQRFSEMLRAALGGEPQVVTRHGEEVAVLLDIAHYRRLTGESVGLMAYVREGLWHGTGTPVELEIERSRERPREVDLAG